MEKISNKRNEMKKILLIGIILSFLPLCGAYSYHGVQQRLSPEEFKQKQQDFITQEAQLSKKEAASFFPVYFLLQDEKAALNRKAHLLFKRGNEVSLSEKDYKTILDELQDIRIQQAQLEKDYYDKFSKILSYEKIYKIQQAETKFHRQLIRGVHRKGRGGRNK